MRTVWLVLLTCVLAWGLWTFLQDAEEAPERPLEPEVQPRPDPNPARPRVTTGTLVVRVRTPSGAVPPGSSAGYLFGGEPRLKPVGPTGEARFTDAPLGELTTIGRAPGHAEIRQRRAVLAGIRADVLLVLRPVEDDGPR